MTLPTIPTLISHQHANNMPLPPTYLASHHHIFQKAMTAVLPTTIVSLPSYPSETTPLQSANHQLAFDFNSDSTAEHGATIVDKSIQSQQIHLQQTMSNN
jgi:hypothetical protein